MNGSGERHHLQTFRPTQEIKDTIKEEEKRLAGNGAYEQQFGGGSFTVKNRKPTMMPYNLPGDDIEGNLDGYGI